MRVRLACVRTRMHDVCDVRGLHGVHDVPWCLCVCVRVHACVRVCVRVRNACMRDVRDVRDVIA